jgi:hypothetical protein
VILPRLCPFRAGAGVRPCLASPETQSWWTRRLADPGLAGATSSSSPKRPRLLGKGKDLLAGATLYSIAKSWNEQGFRTRQRADRPEGNPWNGTTVRRVLDNPKCAGLRTIGTGKDREILYEDGKPVEGDWPAIVDKETWEAAHYVLGNPSRRTNSAQVRKYLLGGILRCGSCDRGLGSARNSRGVAVYKCKNWQFCSNGVVRNQEQLDGWVRSRRSRSAAGLHPAAS